MTIKKAIIGTALMAMTAPAAALNALEAMVFDANVAGVYRDGSDDGLLYFKRSGEHMVVIQGKYSPAFLIESVATDSMIEHTVNVIDGNDGIYTFNLISSMMIMTAPNGNGSRMTRVRDFTQRDLNFIEPIMVSAMGQGAIPEPIKASFDCAKAGTRVEKLICSEAGVAELDVAVSQRYKSAMTMADDKAFYRQDQRNWIKERNQCGDIQCLVESHHDRIEQLDLVIYHMNKPAEFR